MEQIKLFHVVLRTPERIVYEGSIQSLSLLQEQGRITFLANFVKSFGNITEGLCSFVDEDGAKRTFITSNGFFTVDSNVIVVNAPIIEFGDSVEKVMAEKNSEIQERVEKHSRSRKEYTKSKMEMAKNLTGENDSDN